MKSNKLSNAELDVMMALWELGSGSVSDVQKSLVGGANKDYAYTTVATLLKRMEDKQAVSSVKSGRSFVYEPVEKLDDFRKTRLSDIVRQFFDGRPSRL
ncbi:MAG: BlaI/MecI/CopY family transcriptional regulator, partial [Hyphomicrobiales bacterium]